MGLLGLTEHLLVPFGCVDLCTNRLVDRWNSYESNEFCSMLCKIAHLMITAQPHNVHQLLPATPLEFIIHPVQPHPLRTARLLRKVRRPPHRVHKPILGQHQQTTGGLPDERQRRHAAQAALVPLARLELVAVLRPFQAHLHHSSVAREHEHIVSHGGAPDAVAEREDAALQHGRIAEGGGRVQHVHGPGVEENADGRTAGGRPERPDVRGARVQHAQFACGRLVGVCV